MIFKGHLVGLGGYQRFMRSFPSFSVTKLCRMQRCTVTTTSETQSTLLLKSTLYEQENKALNHVSVLRDEALKAWYAPSISGGYYVDGTVGAGGHSALLLEKFPDAKLLCIDKDPATLSATSAYLRKRFESNRIKFAHGCFSDLQTHLRNVGFPPHVSGILLDLGVSSMQIDQSQRGFSFLQDGPLDMRMNSTASIMTAADVCNTFTLSQLEQIFQRFGEEPSSGLAARLVVERRRNLGAFTRTSELAECLLALSSGKKQRRRGNMKVTYKRKHPATRCFQALRIFVNGEVDALQFILDSCYKKETSFITPGGRLAIISFHSLEDRPTKRAFRNLDLLRKENKTGGLIINSDKTLEKINDDTTHWKLLYRKAVKPSAKELSENIRSRSARLRAIERII